MLKVQKKRYSPDDQNLFFLKMHGLLPDHQLLYHSQHECNLRYVSWYQGTGETILQVMTDLSWKPKLLWIKPFNLQCHAVVYCYGEYVIPVAHKFIMPI